MLRLPVPQALHEHVLGHDLAPGERQDGEQSPLAHPAERRAGELASVVLDRQWSDQPDPHRHLVRIGSGRFREGLSVRVRRHSGPDGGPPRDRGGPIVTTEQVMEKALSSDGTPIAFWRSGTGRPLVLVHGTTADHSRWHSVRGLLEDLRHAVRPRSPGPGPSGDAEDYAFGLEVEDVVAVVDAIADEWGGPVDLLGHSYGAYMRPRCGLCTRPNLRRLVLYEAPS